MFYGSASSGLFVVLECCFELKTNGRVRDLTFIELNLFESFNFGVS